LWLLTADISVRAATATISVIRIANLITEQMNTLKVIDGEAGIICSPSEFRW